MATGLVCGPSLKGIPDRADYAFISQAVRIPVVMGFVAVSNSRNKPADRGRHTGLEVNMLAPVPVVVYIVEHPRSISIPAERC